MCEQNARLVLLVRVVTNSNFCSKVVCVMLLLLLCLLSHVWYYDSGRNAARQYNYFRRLRIYSRILLYNCTLISFNIFKPLNAELNPICHLLALLGAHHIHHVSRIRVKPKTGFPDIEALE
jgi:hypothetical protein